MRKLFFILLIITTSTIQSQIVVNNTDISDLEIFEVWAFKKPFTMKDVYFVNYGQKKFRPNYYNSPKQRIRGIERGEYLKLIQLMERNNYSKIDERIDFIGDNQGRVMVFKKNEQ